ncbi:MAG TPA: peptidyl-prolyl cis-trans isomerase [Pirellulales bacterium]|nr:peptidyl-prolyl cis-trans isomerase [Pirellulales bacterium]
MTRIFYSILYAVTLAAACAIWARQDDNPALRDLIGARRANAQSPDPLNPSGNPMNGPGMNGPGMMPGMNGAGAFNPNNQAAANLQSMGTTAPRMDKAVSRPESWPGAAPAEPASPPVAASLDDGLPGVSISSVPLIPGVGQSYSYKAGAKAGASEQAGVGQISFSQPVESGPISPSQAALAATSWSMAKELEGTKILARVGTEYILAADVLGPVNEILSRNADKIPPDKYDEIRQAMIKQRLEALIQTKMVLAVIRQEVPEEGFKKFSEKIGEQFDNEEIPKALVKSKLKTTKELDIDLHRTGSSLEREKRAYVERQMAMIWIHQHGKGDEEVTHEQMLEYYRKHEKSYEYSAKVRWEQIQVRFDRCPKSDAWRKLAEAGNRIVDGAPFADVAKAVSQGPTAGAGGYHDWTTKGSLVSEALDHALFTLPPGQLSPILDDAKSFQIVRVLERKDAGKTPFSETQNEIKRRIRAERNAVAVQKYVGELHGKVQLWTIYDEVDPDDLRPAKAAPKVLAEAPAAKNPASPPAEPAAPGQNSAQPSAPGYPIATGPVPTIAPTGAPPSASPATAAQPAAYPVADGPPPAYPSTGFAPPASYPSTGSPPPDASRYR